MPYDIIYVVISRRLPAHIYPMLGSVSVSIFLVVTVPYLAALLYWVPPMQPARRALAPHTLYILIAAVAWAVVTGVLMGKSMGRFRFSPASALEIGLAVVISILAPLTDPPLMMWLMVGGFFAALYPLTHGPEPGGWGPLLEVMEERQKRRQAFKKDKK